MKIIYILSLSLLFLTCKNSEEEVTEPLTETTSNTITVSNAQFESQNMQLGTIVAHTFNQPIKVTGFIDVPPQNKAKVNTFFEGYIVNMPHLIGDVVRKGQLIATLEHPSYIEIQQNFLEASEQLTYLKSEFERQKKLFDEQITSQKNYLKAESAYKSTLAHYNGLKQTIKMMNLNPNQIEAGVLSSKINLYAPINGSVTEVNVSNGAYVSPSTVIIEIINTDHIHLELNVFEKDILHIKKGQEIVFRIPESSSKTYKAEVHLVGTSIDSKDRTIKVHGHIKDEEKAQFITGMFIDADIITTSTSGFALPKNAVKNSDNSYFALKLKDENNEGYTFEKTVLKTGQVTENYIEILNAELFKQDKFLTNGAFMILNDSDE